MSREHHPDLLNRFYDDMWNQFDKTLVAEILEPITSLDGIGFERSLPVGLPCCGVDRLESRRGRWLCHAASRRV